MLSTGSPNETKPFWLLAELTYACPLQCAYCANPINFSRIKNELTTEEWLRVFREARSMGAAQLGFSGGEPLVRRDLETLIAYAHELGFYTNLITSAVGMDYKRMEAIKDAGLDSIQISIQAANQELNDFIAGTHAFTHKIEMAKKIKELNMPLTLNFVLHKHNIENVEQMLELAVSLQADYVELANTQYYGFAYHNRDLLLPTYEQVKATETIANRFKERYQDQMKIYYVIPDYYENRPKPCMNGWGKIFLIVTPDGITLPCHSARNLPNLTFPNVRDAGLSWIWNKSPLFNRFRGYDWMKEPCRSCPERFKDFGGCRCQAYLLTGDPENADPVCDLSPHHNVILDAIESARQNTAKKEMLVFRNPRNSKKLTE